MSSVQTGIYILGKKVFLLTKLIKLWLAYGFTEINLFNKEIIKYSHVRFLRS